jgi:hypothetical protein
VCRRRGGESSAADGGEVYHVNLNGARSTCECAGFLRHHCKHLESLAALRQRGKLPHAPAVAV